MRRGRSEFAEQIGLGQKGPWSNRGQNAPRRKPLVVRGDAERGESNFAAFAVDTLCEAEMREARCEQRLAVFGNIQPLLHHKSNVAGGRFSATAAATGRDDRDRLPSSPLRRSQIGREARCMVQLRLHIDRSYERLEGIGQRCAWPELGCALSSPGVVDQIESKGELLCFRDA
jgi:hypothetical protein